MGLETASYIKGLNSSNPLSTDSLGQIDDHLRLIKAVLKNTFPNLDGPVTVTPKELNSPIPIGVITAWYGAEANVPAGWAICDGRTVDRTDGGGKITTPDLRDKVPIGASSTRPQGSVVASGTGTTAGGGAINTTFGTSQNGDHAHGGATAGHSLTVDQLPPHTHGLPNLWNMGTGAVAQMNLFGGGDIYLANQTGSTGSGHAHAHGIVADGNHAHTVTVTVGDHTHSYSTIPPHVALHYIMKV